MFLSCHYLVLGIDGIGLKSTQLNGRVLEAAADLMFVLLLILVAKGYTVTRARLPQASSIKLAVFVCAYSTIYTTLFIYERIHFDPGTVLYIYESVAGYGLIILRIIGWCMFIYSTFFTLKHYPEKGGFYYPYFSFYTLWFVSGPCIIIIANHIIAEWVREKVKKSILWFNLIFKNVYKVFSASFQVVVSVEHFVVICGHFVFLVLTRPAAQNKNFPYHVRTTQIGIMEAMTTNTSLGPNTLDRFANGGSYEISAPATSMDVFTVDSASRAAYPQQPPPPPPYSNPQVPNGLPRWSITNQTVPPTSTYQNGNSTAKIYDPNDDDNESDNKSMWIFQVVLTIKWNTPSFISSNVCIGKLNRQNTSVFIKVILDLKSR